MILNPDLRKLQLAEGKVMGIQTRAKLLASDCFYIGIVAKNDLQFNVAVEWLKEAIRLARIDGTTDISTAQTELIHIIKEVCPERFVSAFNNGKLIDLDLIIKINNYSMTNVGTFKILRTTTIT